MDTLDNLRNRAKKIKAAFLSESVTNEEEGMLFLDIINFFANNTIDGGSSTLDKKYWNKEEIKFLEEYLLVYDEKIKAGYADYADNAGYAGYADKAGDTLLWSNAQFKDFLDQPVRTTDPVKFESVIAKAFTEEDNPDNDNTFSSRLIEEVGGTIIGGTLGSLDNVDDLVDEEVEDSVILVKNKGTSWTIKKLSEIGGGGTGEIQRNVRIVNNLDSKNISASKGEPCNLKFTFTSQERYGSEPYEDTGERGLCQISIKNTINSEFVVVKQIYITSGTPYIFDCAEHITSGANNIMIKVTGEITEVTTPAFVYTVQLTSLSISANNFKWWTAYTGNITLPLNIGGNIAKTLYILVSGADYNREYQVPIGTGIYIDTAYNYSIPHPEQTGVFNVSAYVSNSDGTIKTRTILFQVMCVITGAQHKLIAINNVLAKATNWVENSLFDYAMYDGNNVYTSAQFLIQKDEADVFSSNEDAIATSTKHTFSLPMEVDTIDNSEFNIYANVLDGAVPLTTPIRFAVNNSLGYSAVTGAVMYINPRTRSNRQGNFKEVINEIGSVPIPPTWKNMNWGNDGWTVDANGNRVLRLMAGSLLTMDYAPFEKECARTGKTIEIDYKIDNVTDYTKSLLTISTPLGDDFIGLNIYADEIIMHSQSLKNDSVQSLHTFEGRRIKLTLTILPDAYGNPGFNLCMLYIDEVKNREFTYENNDYFAHPGKIVIGSDYADVDIYGIREYNSALTSQGVLTNYVNWLTDTTSKSEVRHDNDILDSNGSEVDFENTKDQYNVIVYDQTIPSMANQTARKGTLEVFFVDHPEWNVQITVVAAKGQGTSSKKYWVWNTSYGLDKVLSVITRADGSTTTKKWQMVPWIPAGQKFTAKKNFASSMQSHKIGAVNSYTDLYKEVGLLNEAMQNAKYADARVSVYQLPFICFEKSINEELKAIYTFKGLYTFGPDKGDKYTFGFDTDLFPGLIAIEGADNSPLCTLFRVPWNNNVAYNEEEEAFQYNGANSWDFGGGDTANITKFIPAYNFVYQCSPRLLPFAGTLNELNAQASILRNEPFEFWIANAGDVNQYNVYYFETSLGMFIASDIGNGTINLASQLVDKGYGLSTSDLTGKSNDALNQLFIHARIAKFRAEASTYWDIDDTLFFMNNVEFNAGTDERAKNTYPYCFGTETSKWRWRVDDADTRFDTTNRGLPDKSYSVETHDIDENGASIWNGETNNFFNLMELAFPAEKIISMRKTMTAMQSLSGMKSGNDLEKIYAFYKKYFFDQAQEYFPANGYNADAKYAYEHGKLAYINGSYTNDTDPITQSLGNHYLAEQRWITKRIIYMMSKYSFGLFSAEGTDTITVRAAGNTIKYELTPAMDMYPAIANGTSIIRGGRTKAGKVCHMEIELSGSGDQQNTIQGASYLMDIGDWYDKNVSGSMIVQGRMLRDIRLGSKTHPVLISIRSLTISNCVSLQRLMLSNIASLSGTLNLVDCTHLIEVHADGTSISQIRLPIGGGLRVVEFSAYNLYLSLSNYPLMTNAGVNIESCKGIITDFFIVDCPLMNPVELLVKIMTAQAGQTNHALKRIRAVGFDETYYTSEMLDKLAELADGSYVGLSSAGLAGEDEIPVLDGKLTVHANVYEDSINTLKHTFTKLMLNVVGIFYIRFKDPEIQRLAINAYSSDKIGVSRRDVEKITLLEANIFKGNTTIKDFSDFGEVFTNVETISGDSFNTCINLNSIKLPVNKKVSIGTRAFQYTSLDENSIDFTQVTKIGAYAFFKCKFKRVYLPFGIDLTEAANAFSENQYLTELEIGEGQTFVRQLTGICPNLIKLVYPSTIRVLEGSIIHRCDNFKYLVMKPIIPPTFFNMTNLGYTQADFSIYVPDESVDAYKTADVWKTLVNRIKPMSVKPENV